MGVMTQAIECPLCLGRGAVDAAVVTEYRKGLAEDAARRLEALDPMAETAAYAKQQSEFYSLDSFASQKVASGYHRCPACDGRGSMSPEEAMRQAWLYETQAKAAR